jgi:hypothetical protein
MKSLLTNRFSLRNTTAECRIITQDMADHKGHVLVSKAAKPPSFNLTITNVVCQLLISMSVQGIAKPLQRFHLDATTVKQM